MTCHSDHRLNELWGVLGLLLCICASLHYLIASSLPPVIYFYLYATAADAVHSWQFNLEESLGHPAG